MTRRRRLRRTVTVTLAVTLAGAAFTGGAAAAGTAPAEVAAPTPTPSASPSSPPSRPATPPPQTPAPASPAASTVDSRIASLLTTRSKAKPLAGSVHVHVVDVTTGRDVYSSAGSAGVMPASSMKVLTAVNAFTVLGGQAALPTTVHRAEDDLVVLTGGGDPLLTTADLRALADTTAAWWKKTKPRSVLRVAVDDSRFGAASGAPTWEAGYLGVEAAPVRPLSRLGDYSMDASTRATRVFVSRLKDAGVRTWFLGRRQAADGAPVVAQRSHTVEQAVRVMLGKSENNVAETLFRHVGLAASGDTSWAAASRAAAATLTRLGVPTAGLVLADGSGLSRANRVSPQAFTAALRLAADGRHPHLAALYFGKSLPVAGQTGTLGPGYGRFTTKPSSCARGKVLAKTGTLHDVLSLTGVTPAADGSLKAFSFIVTDRTTSRYSDLSGRQALDAMAATVTGCW